MHRQQNDDDDDEENWKNGETVRNMKKKKPKQNVSQTKPHTFCVISLSAHFNCCANALPLRQPPKSEMEREREQLARKIMNNNNNAIVMLAHGDKVSNENTKYEILFSAFVPSEKQFNSPIRIEF